MIAVEKSDIPEATMSKIKIAQLGSSDDLVVGEQVVAIGNALGYGQSVTSGWVSAQDDCDTIGEGQNLGELKSYVLLQVLNLKFGEQIYVFCSDDKNARNGVISIGGAQGRAFVL